MKISVLCAALVLCAPVVMADDSQESASGCVPLTDRKTTLTSDEREPEYTAGGLCIGVYSNQPSLNRYGYYYPYRPYYYNYFFYPYRPYYYNYNYGW